MEQRRGIAAYGICRDAGRVLLTRASTATRHPGRWQLPGGGLRHGADPADAVVRAFAQQTGLAVQVTAVDRVVADVLPLPSEGIALHTDRIVYRVRQVGGTLPDGPVGGTLPDGPVGGTLPDGPAGTTDRAAWLAPDRWAELPTMPFTADLLGVAGQPLDPRDAVRPDRPDRPAEPATGHPKGQRFAAYGVVTDPTDRMLLTLIAPGYPGAGRWHLPGGGTDHGEDPAAALRRELAEESGQSGRVTALLDVSHRHDPAALGPEGHPVDWHVVRAVYRVVVDQPTEPVVTEAAGGSTLRSAWFTAAEVAGLATTDITARSLAALAPAGPPAGR